MSGAVIWAGSPRRQGGLCSESPGASRGLLGIPRGTAWWPGLLRGHLGPLVISQMANPDPQTLNGDTCGRRTPREGSLRGSVSDKEEVSAFWGPASPVPRPAYLLEGAALGISPAPSTGAHGAARAPTCRAREARRSIMVARSRLPSSCSRRYTSYRSFRCCGTARLQSAVGERRGRAQCALSGP